jgi:hypothetical protein
MTVTCLTCKPYKNENLHSTIFWAQQPLVGQDLLTVQASRSHSFRQTTLSRTPLMSDQSDAVTSIHQHTALTKDRQPNPGGIRTHNPSIRATADQCLRPRGHWDRLHSRNTHTNSIADDLLAAVG